MQKHDATRLHFDFRLAIGGVLKSWAVPKGIPLEPGERRLAVRVEDHPVDYGSFEGIIPAGEYGGGTVMLWDRGTFFAEDGNPDRALSQGKLSVELRGDKLRGGWTLVRLRATDNQWLLIKTGKALRPKSESWDRSVATGRTLDEIAGSGRRRPKPLPAGAGFIEPMKAKPSEALPKGREWLYELKLDGFRFMASKAGPEVRLFSRSEKDLTPRFPAVAAAIAKLRCTSAMIDGELVVADEKGRPSFQLIQNADERTPVQAFAFDLVSLDGENLAGRTLTERRERLATLLRRASAPLHLSAELKGDPDALLAEVAGNGLEGLIAKRRSSSYEPGRRSGAWVKVKCLREQEFVIGGFTAPKGSREAFGALLAGYYRGKDLVFAGKVGTGFDGKMLRQLRAQMVALQAASCPFIDLPRPRSSRWGQPLTRAEMARCTWVRPELVCQVRFTEWTDDGNLRHPTFVGMRDDKSATEVVRET